MTTRPEHYYQPRPAVRPDDDHDISLEYEEATWLERYGQLIAYAMGLIAFGWIAGIMVVAALIGSLS